MSAPDDLLQQTLGLPFQRQGLHGQLIQRPRSPELQPDPELLAVRYERFRAVGAAGGA